MSASSLWVTWGTFSHERCRKGPETFLIRGSGTVSVGPNLEKSWAGISGMPAPAGAAAAGAGDGPRTAASRSSLVIRPFSPVPLMVLRSMPNSRASRRTLGPAWGPVKSAIAPGGAAGAGAAGGAGAGEGATAGGAWAAGAGAGAGPAGVASGGGSCWPTRLGGVVSGPAPSPPTTTMTVPSLTVSPTLTLTSWTWPEAVEGTSMVALSDSRVTSGSSSATTSPGATCTSIIGTSWKSPMSGTAISVVATVPSDPASSGRPGSAAGRVRLVRVDAVLGDRLGDGLRRHRALLGEGLQRGEGDEVPVDLEEPAQLAAVVGAAEPVGPQHLVGAGHERADLVGERLDVVGGRDHRSLPAVQAGGHVALARRLGWVQQVPPLDLKGLAPQLGEAGGAPDVGVHPEVVGQQVGAGDHLAQDGPAAQQLHPRPRLGPAAALAGRAALPEQVHPLEDPLGDAVALGHGRVLVVLVHHGQVVEDVLLVGVHPPQAVLDDDGQLVGEGRVVGDAVGDHRGHDVAVAVLVLEALAVQGGAAGGAADQEPPGPAVPGGPGQVADALEAEHRVVDVERDHRAVAVAVGGRGRDPGRHRPRLVDALLEQLPGPVLLVEHQLVGVLGLVELAQLGPDPELAEHALHAEGARLVGHDRDHPLADLLVAQQGVEDPHERHRGRDLPVPGSGQLGAERRQLGHGQRGRPLAADRQVAAKGPAPLVQVTCLRSVVGGSLVGVVEQLVVRDRQAEAVPEHPQGGLGHLLLLVGDVLALAGLAHTVALDRLGQDHGRLAGVVHRRLVGRVDLDRVVAARLRFQMSSSLMSATSSSSSG